MTAESTAETKTHHQPRITQRGGYSAELETWLTTHESLLGERSAFSGLVASIERGATSGNSGTKGCGITRVEPFENWKKLRDVHNVIGRAGKCEMAFRMLTTYERWLLCARYLFVKTALPAGMHGTLGDLSAVAFVVADRLGLQAVIWQDASNQRTRRWESVAVMALKEAHQQWQMARAEVDRELAAESGQ
jgi:hypothetical protein